MAYEPRPGSMSLFKNDRKEQPNHPDYKGDGMDLEGNPVWISAWLKETSGGKKFFSISLKLKEPKATDDFRGHVGGGSSGGVAGRDASSFSVDLDDEIPF